MTTKGETILALGELLPGGKFTPAALVLYLNAIEELTPEQTAAAAAQYIRTPGKVFMPRPSELIGIAREWQTREGDGRAQHADALHDQTRHDLRARLQALKEIWYAGGMYDRGAYTAIADEAKRADLLALASDALEQAARIEAQ